MSRDQRLADIAEYAAMRGMPFNMAAWMSVCYGMDYIRRQIGAAS